MGTALSLFALADEYKAIADQLAEMDADEQTLTDTLEGEAFPVEQKAKAIAAVIGNLDAEATAYSEHAKKVAAYGKARAARADWLRSYLKTAMQRTGIKEIKADSFVIKLRDNPGSVNIFEPGLIPEKYMRVPDAPPPEPNKKEISDAIRLGIDVPGAKMIKTQRVEIK